MNRWGKGQEQGGSGSEKVGHLLFHEAAKALRVVSVGVPPWGRAQPCLNTHPCCPSSRSCRELTLRLLPNPGVSDTHRPSWEPGMESSSLSVSGVETGEPCSVQAWLDVLGTGSSLASLLLICSRKLQQKRPPDGALPLTEPAPHTGGHLAPRGSEDGALTCDSNGMAPKCSPWRQKPLSPEGGSPSRKAHVASRDSQAWRARKRWGGLG